MSYTFIYGLAFFVARVKKKGVERFIEINCDENNFCLMIYIKRLE